jgi:molybdopterin/thiamine biosynthesis adenylyltransferase
LYLAAAGVGRLLLIDDDVIETSNLPRQIAYTEADVGRPKVAALAREVLARSGGIQVETRIERVSETDDVWFDEADLVLDASDSQATRLILEDATRSRSKPWIMGAAIQMTGQWIAFSDSRSEGCYHCLNPALAPAESGGCARLGVLGPVVGSIALMQASQALMALAGNEIPWGQLQLFDFRSGEQSRLTLSPSARCRICGDRGLS